MKYIRKFCDLSMHDVPLVGGKNASLGQMVSQLHTMSIKVPDGFAITAEAYWYVLEHNNLLPELKKQLAIVGKERGKVLREVGKKARSLIASAHIPDDLSQEIAQAYAHLSQQYNVENADVAVRSSATAEDLPTASFAGQQETYLNIRGVDQLLDAVNHSMASLFTDRAIVYRQEKGFDHFDVALSVGVQKMIRADKACSGVAFSLDTETGFSDVVMINASYGLGESIVQGLVTPDEYMVHKPTFKKGFTSIIKKQLGDKKTSIVYGNQDGKKVQAVDVAIKDQNQFCLSEDEIVLLTRMIMTIEDHYSDNAGKWMPMDIEWAKDGIDGKLYILQARPETVHSSKNKENGLTITQYTLKDTQKINTLAQGVSIGQHIATGTARLVSDIASIDAVKEGDIIVTTMTDPDWVPAMKRAAGIITERGGRTCHAAIVSRELGVPAIIGVENVLRVLKDGQTVTIDCSRGATGYIYDGAVPFEKHKVVLEAITQPPVDIMVNCADPSRAFTISFLPVAGVGLARLEFIITQSVKVHPCSVLYPEKIIDTKIQEKIAFITRAYQDKKQFFVDTLAHNVGMIAAAFYPRPVIVRLSDFKTNEYRNLIGGMYFEQKEENPMLGFRGASRYYHEKYADAFALECAALQKVRDIMGLTNVKVMVPFVRTLIEAQKVTELMAQHGLKRGVNGLEFVMMCEIPSNVLLIEQFAHYFDGFSIGSNDLTQLTLGVDRDSELLSDLFDERDLAVKEMFALAIKGAHKAQKYIGICGQAPSDYPEIAQFLIKCGIDSLSLNSDTVLPFLMQKKIF